MAISLKNHEDRISTLEKRNFGINSIFTSTISVNKDTTKTITVPASTKFVVYEFTVNDNHVSWTWRYVLASYQYLKTIGTIKIGSLYDSATQFMLMTHVSPDKIKIYGGSDGNTNSNVHLRNFYAITYLISYRASSMFKEVVSWLSL